MSKKWYPVIDYTECAECGACVDMCRHGVYDKAKAPTPVVVFPDGCIEGCKGCGSQCPAGAIQYVGDTASEGGCGCECAGGCCG
ncbi:MAG: ATP-binding protein [Christensenellales bacterium]